MGVYFPQYYDHIKRNYELLLYMHIFISLCRVVPTVTLKFLSIINFDIDRIESDEQFSIIENIHDIIIYQMGYANLKK